MTSDLVIWPNVISVIRDDYKTERAYKQAYHDANRHYAFKVRVDGGWKFFTHSTDYQTWKNQK